jgi:hypothetical protein
VLSLAMSEVAAIPRMFAVVVQVPALGERQALIASPGGSLAE